MSRNLITAYLPPEHMKDHHGMVIIALTDAVIDVLKKTGFIFESADHTGRDISLAITYGPTDEDALKKLRDLMPAGTDIVEKHV